MNLKKSAKTGKNEKTQHPNECFKSIKHFKSNFLNFEFFLACSERKMVKNVFFGIFSKIVIFGNRNCRKISFLKMFTLINFHALVKKLHPIQN